MIRTLEAIVDEPGQVRLAELSCVAGCHRALVTVLDEPPAEALETALPSESGLSDWSHPEEDDAWFHLQ
jgi:hypothetical protein